jgi:hypothetical protein
MFRRLTVFLVLATATMAADFKQARVLDFQDISEVAGGTVSGPASNGVSITPTAHVPSAILKCEVTLELEGKTYTAIFVQDRHFQMTDLHRGELIPVRVEGKKLSMRRPSDGKEIKGKIVSAGEADSRLKK